MTGWAVPPWGRAVTSSVSGMDSFTRRCLAALPTQWIVKEPGRLQVTPSTPLMMHEVMLEVQ